MSDTTLDAMAGYRQKDRARYHGKRDDVEIILPTQWSGGYFQACHTETTESQYGKTPEEAEAKLIARIDSRIMTVSVGDLLAAGAWERFCVSKGLITRAAAEARRDRCKKFRIKISQARAWGLVA